MESGRDMNFLGVYVNPKGSQQNVCFVRATPGVNTKCFITLVPEADLGMSR